MNLSECMVSLRDINTTSKELKTERDCSHRWLFRNFGARQYGTTTRESSDEKYPRRISYVYIIIIADQVFIDPTCFGIFVCGPLQSLVVNVCL